MSANATRKENYDRWNLISYICTVHTFFHCVRCCSFSHALVRTFNSILKTKILLHCTRRFHSDCYCFCRVSLENRWDIASYTWPSCILSAYLVRTSYLLINWLRIIRRIWHECYRLYVLVSELVVDVCVIDMRSQIVEEQDEPRQLIRISPRIHIACDACSWHHLDEVVDCFDPAFRVHPPASWWASSSGHEHLIRCVNEFRQGFNSCMIWSIWHKRIRCIENFAMRQMFLELLWYILLRIPSDENDQTD